MDFLTMMQTRKSCRAYQDRPVSREDLLKIVEAGRLTPSGCNSQPWKFIVIDEPEAKEKLCDAIVVENGQICAVLLAKEGAMEYIRVLIKASDYSDAFLFCIFLFKSEKIW